MIEIVPVRRAFQGGAANLSKSPHGEYRVFGAKIRWLLYPDATSDSWIRYP
jgi:hypothetical protein